MPGAEPIRILIVDAYGHSREGLRVSLLGGGCQVETASGCWEAIKKVKEGPEIRAQAERLGVTRVLEKPINPRELRALVQTLGAERDSLAGSRGERR